MSDIKIEQKLVAEVCQDFESRIRVHVVNYLKDIVGENGDHIDPEKCSRVLVLPKLNNLAIFILQEKVLELYPSLLSFIIGNEHRKRIVLCSKYILQRKILQINLNPAIVLDEEPIPISELEIAEVKSLMILEQYNRNNAKRPDQQLYIPRSLRLLKDKDQDQEKKNDSNSMTNYTRGSSQCQLPEVKRIKGTLWESDFYTPPDPQKIKEKELEGDEEKVEIEDHGLRQPEPDEVWRTLTKEHLHEIFETVGMVDILKPNNWEQLEYDMQITVDESALGHILEVYDFPSSFQSGDLIKIFSAFVPTGFNVKWVDDTHALLVFPSSAIASEALCLKDPIMKSRPVAISSKQSKLKINRNQEFLLPYRERPKTVSTIARRMLSNALGKDCRVDTSIRKKEERIIQKAKDEKKIEKIEFVRAQDPN